MEFTFDYPIHCFMKKWCVHVVTFRYIFKLDLYDQLECDSKILIVTQRNKYILVISCGQIQIHGLGIDIYVTT